MSAQKPELTFLNYITDEQFRASLEADHREMTTALAQGCWKSAQVMAGSMIEAVLIDHILGKNTDPTKTEKILKLDLSTAIDQCKADKALTEKTAGLCIVVKDFRNLIHPGRIIRLQQTVSEDDAKVAATLVKMVAEDIAKKRQESYGYTAEQVIEKIKIDSMGFTGLMKSILAKLQDREKKRLLFELLPAINNEVRNSWFNVETWERHDLRRQLECIKSCFDELSTAIPDPVKRELVTRFVTFLQMAPSTERRNYETAFFSSFFLANATPDQRETVLDHYFTVLRNGSNQEFINNITSLGQWLDDSPKSRAWLQDFYRAYFAEHGMPEEDFKKWYQGVVWMFSDVTYDTFHRIAEDVLTEYNVTRPSPRLLEKAKEVAAIEKIPF